MKRTKLVITAVIAVAAGFISGRALTLDRIVGLAPEGLIPEVSKPDGVAPPLPPATSVPLADAPEAPPPGPAQSPSSRRAAPEPPRENLHDLFRYPLDDPQATLGWLTPEREDEVVGTLVEKLGDPSLEPAIRQTFAESPFATLSLLMDAAYSHPAADPGKPIYPEGARLMRNLDNPYTRLFLEENVMPSFILHQPAGTLDLIMATREPRRRQHLLRAAFRTWPPSDDPQLTIDSGQARLSLADYLEALGPEQRAEVATGLLAAQREQLGADAVARLERMAAE